MAYLLLQDGSLFEGKINGENKNLLGEMTLTQDENILIDCPVTHDKNLIVGTSAETTGQLSISDMDFQCLKEKIKYNKNILGKIITDSLPVEFHVYDLKTCITSGLK